MSTSLTAIFKDSVPKKQKVVEKDEPLILFITIINCGECNRCSAHALSSHVLGEHHLAVLKKNYPSKQTGAITDENVIAAITLAYYLNHQCIIQSEGIKDRLKAANNIEKLAKRLWTMEVPEDNTIDVGEFQLLSPISVTIPSDWEAF